MQSVIVVTESCFPLQGFPRIAADVAKLGEALSGGWAMALTPEHRAELEVLGPETVRIRLRSSDLVTLISGFKTPTTRSDVEGWLTEKRAKVIVANGGGLFRLLFSHPLQRRLFCYRWT